MKSGAGSPFDDEDFDEEPEETADDTEVVEREPATTTESEPTTDTETTSDLPYKYRRDGVQDGRNHGNIFLRDEAQQHIDDLVHELDGVFENEAVYKIDVLEAAVLAAGDPERTVEGELRKMGYGMK
ncbi:hypothetical protein NDI85_19790 [Halomicroarcula sp. S1AR25-4]|uniref:hypothetical protein n=1 Tax=Haloarcula sp. S1AR25-4 TaxID=2950538 RepID=UPI002876D10A|nr:hypothetical protein [Halomicroarcula sp. S1AR25-4]MDS0280031.1 hypothetical protein [Halomicroarcula sp. S1AR25-4]